MNRKREIKLRRDLIVAAKRHKKNQKRKDKRYIESASYSIQGRPIRETDRTLLPAPIDFSITTNRDAVIHYFMKVDRHVQNRIPAILDMSPIRTTDMPTICLLMSMMMDKRLEALNFKRYIMVRYPNESHPAGLLFKKVQFEETVMKNEGIANHNYFLSRINTRVNRQYKSDIIKQTEDFFGNKADVSSLNPILTEIMSNTQNHADPKKKQDEPNKIPWFAALMPLAEEKKICYCIVDLGSGIVENWNIKGIKQRKRNRVQATLIDSLFKDSQGGILRKRIPEGLESSTRLIYRGQGLKTIYDQANNGPFQKFILITNKAKVDFLNMGINIPDSEYNLKGTIYYWELTVG